MALPPNISNYTVPGGVKLFFDDGTGERDLGNIVNLDLTPGTEELEHFSNRSGKRLKDASLVLEEKLTFKFTMDEPVVENWQYFLKGGALENIGAGTAALVDQKVTLDGVKLMSLGQHYGLTSVTARQFLNYVLSEKEGVFTDNSIEADTLVGTPFTVMADTDTYLYLGKLTPFKSVKVDLQGLGTYVSIVYEYWDGETWTEFTGAGSGHDFDGDGVITLPTLAGWSLYTLNAKQAYWIRCKAGTVTAAATVNSFRSAAVVLTDFVLDAGIASVDGRLPGRVGRIAAGIFEDGEEIMVSFSAATWTSSRFAIAASAFPTGSARIQVHPSSGRGLQFDIEIPKCQLKPTDNITLNDKEWMTIPMTLEVLDDSNNNPTFPLGRFVLYDTNA